MHGKKRVTEEFSNTGKVEEVLVKFGTFRLVTKSETGGTAEATGVQLNDSVLLHANSVLEGGDSRDSGRAEQIWNLQGFSDQSACGV